MNRGISSFTQGQFDVLIIGGGIFGVCAAWEAASRGLSVVLLEKGDFSQATSSNHFKVVHGGIRYLQHADFRRLRESCRERSALLRIAPHLVYPLPILIPTVGSGLQGKTLLRAGFFLYDLLTFDRNRGIHDPGRRIPACYSLNRDQVCGLVRQADDSKLTGGAVFWDGQIYSPPRLAISFLRSAVQAGAVVANYTEVTGFVREGDRIVGVRAQDRVGGSVFETRAKVVLNATGPWASDLLRRSLSLRWGGNLTFSRDVALVVARPLPKAQAIACRIASKDKDAILDRGGRHLFFAPWRGFTLIGVWHVVHRGAPDEFKVTRDDLVRFVEEANQASPGFGLQEEHVVMVNSGLILFGGEADESEYRFGKRSVLIDHQSEEGIEGLITLVGVRATMARGLAERAVDLLDAKLGRPETRSTTCETPIFGGDIGDFEEFLQNAIGNSPAGVQAHVMRALIHNYGSEYLRILAIGAEDPAMLETVGDSPVLKAEVVHAVREEMVVELSDVVLRRTDLGSAGHPGESALELCADLVSSELSWSCEKRTQELDKLREFFAQQGRLKDFRSRAHTPGLDPAGAQV